MADSFEQRMHQEWDMGLWFAQGLDERGFHPEELDWLVPNTRDAQALRRATRRE